MCVLGSTVVVLHSPKEQEVESIEDLLEKVRDPGKTAVGSSRNSIASCAFKCLVLLATKRDVTRRTICCVHLSMHKIDHNSTSKHIDLYQSR